MAWKSMLEPTDSTNGSVAVIDLSLVPADVLQMLIAVLGRLVFLRAFNGIGG